MKPKTKKIIVISVSAFLLLGAVLFCLVWNGIIILNGISAGEYPIRGVDVSAYQGEIDWQELSAQNISFAFIKATEGSSHVDERFDYNFKEAQKTDLAVGAYHFFSFDSAGASQAENFIDNVKAFEGMLPPTVDFEFYGDKEKNPPKKEAVTKELDVMLEMLTEHYGQRPIIYATEKSYELYLSGGYEKYDIWIRNVITSPRLSDGRAWTFWQYTNRERLRGYNGEEKYIDMNVFYGNDAEFREYLN